MGRQSQDEHTGAADIVGPAAIEHDLTRRSYAGDPIEPEHERCRRGTELGRYLVLDWLGSGGLGDVYLAYDPELHRRVAVKLLRSAKRSSQARLLREAQALARVSHPNVVTIYDVGTFDGRVYIAMELVDGSTFRQWLRAQSRTWQQIRDVLERAGQGLLAAHRAGLVHRDFKPENVLVGHDGRVCVLDFGLARAAGPDPSNSVSAYTLGDLAVPGGILEEHLTRAGVCPGTPAYMAPEQFGLGSVDERTDQFGFCVTFYEAVNDVRPFVADDLQGLLEAIVEQRLSAPSGVAVPSWLQRVLARGLAAESSDRFDSMADLLEALQEDRRRQRRRWKFALAIAGAVATMPAFVVWTRPDAMETVDESPVDRLAGQAYEAAANAYYVYPSAEDPDGPTAFRKILELERLDPPIMDHGRDRGRQLRREFSQTLIRLGDHYWQREGGQPFASDYYAWSLVFDPDQPRALDRVAWTPGQLEALRRKAADGGFSAGELIAMQPLVALAQPDDDHHVERLARVYRGKRRPSVAVSQQLEDLLGDKNMQQVLARAADNDDDPNAGRGDRTTTKGQGVDPGSAEAAQDPSGAAGQGVPRSRRWVQEQLRASKVALAHGRVQEAEASLQRVLHGNRNDPDALLALAEIYFDQGAYQKATKFAERAVVSAPKRASARVMLADCYYKALRYEDARREYQRASDLGDRGAKTMLRRLDDKLSPP